MLPERESTDRVILENGLRVLVDRRVTAPVVAVLVMYRAGSVSDPDGLTGIAHLTEHMMFRGSARFPDGSIDELTNRLGGVNNAMTTNDYAAYYFVLPAESWRVALEIEADRMTGCLLDPTSFDTERRIAIEERQMLDDEPDAVLDEALEFMAYDHHPYRFPVVGLLDDLERMTVSDVRDFYRDTYAPDNAVLVVAGDVEAGAVEDAVRAAFEDVASTRGDSATGVPIRHRPPAPEPRQQGPRRVTLERECGIPRVTVGFHCPEATHQDSPAVEIVTTLLGTGRSSRLYGRLVAAGGDVNEVSVGRTLQRDPGLLTVAAELSEDGDVAACETQILDEIRGLARRTPPPEELEKAKLQWRLDHLIGRESSLGKAGFLGYWELMDRWELGGDFDRMAGSVTVEDVSRVTALYLDPEVRNTAWMTVTQKSEE